MDVRKLSRIREFLQRKPIKEWFGDEILGFVPEPGLLHPHLKKAIFLRRLFADLSFGVLPEETLQCLLILEEIDRSLGAVAPPAALSAAYCAVAAEFTLAPVRLLWSRDIAIEGGFFGTVLQNWDSQVAELEQSAARGMVGEGMREWRAVINEAVTDAEARNVLLQRDTRGEATEAVREYLGVAVNEMGQPLLELVARVAGVEEDDAYGAEEYDAGGGEDADQSGGEKLTPAGPAGAYSGWSISIGALPERLVQMCHPASEIGMEGNLHVPETGTNITDELAGQTDGLTTDRASEKLPLPSSVEVNKVREALEFGGEELQKVVIDPLPDALERAAVVQISMVEGSTKPSDVCDNPNQTGWSELGPSIQKDVQYTLTGGNANEDNNIIPFPGMPDHDAIDTTARTNQTGGGELERSIEKNVQDILTGRNADDDHNTNPFSNVPDHNSMDIAAPTEDVENSNECPSAESANSSRTCLSTRIRTVSSSVLQEVSKSGRSNIECWTPQEENALGEVVKKHGKGNWKFILQSYPETFKDKTEIDLKDKWRNMSRFLF